MEMRGGGYGRHMSALLEFFAIKGDALVDRRVFADVIAVAAADSKNGLSVVFRVISCSHSSGSVAASRNDGKLKTHYAGSKSRLLDENIVFSLASNNFAIFQRIVLEVALKLGSWTR
jgi:hypothetical protein